MSAKAFVYVTSWMLSYIYNNTHVMVVPIRHADVERVKTCPLPPGLQVLHAYTTLMAGSRQVSIVVRNMMDSAIFLKKGAHV